MQSRSSASRRRGERPRRKGGPSTSAGPAILVRVRVPAGASARRARRAAAEVDARAQQVDAARWRAGPGQCLFSHRSFLVFRGETTSCTCEVGRLVKRPYMDEACELGALHRQIQRLATTEKDESYGPAARRRGGRRHPGPQAVQRSARTDRARACAQARRRRDGLSQRRSTPAAEESPAARRPRPTAPAGRAGPMRPPSPPPRWRRRRARVRSAVGAGAGPPRPRRWPGGKATRAPAPADRGLARRAQRLSADVMLSGRAQSGKPMSRARQRLVGGGSRARRPRREAPIGTIHRHRVQRGRRRRRRGARATEERSTTRPGRAAPGGRRR